LGEHGVTTSALQPGVEGMIRIHGEMWRAISDQEIGPGQPVRVRKIQGLTLHVEPAPQALNQAQNAAKI
jgi:membrane protein implicated in regulation of membrane protease activity